MHIVASLGATLLASAGLCAASTLPEPQYIFTNPVDTTAYRIPTIHESAVQARRILHLNGIGTLSTIFPSAKDVSALENRPSGLGNTPIGLMDYVADCEHSTGNPTILAISIATSFKNVAAGSNISLSMRWVPPSSRPHSPASLPRFSLSGYLEELSPAEVAAHNVPACFVKYHTDAAAWLPGNPIHESKWVRFVVTEVYWIGGFGDRAYIGWIPAEEWRNVTREEVRDCVLPGEARKSGWRDWLGLGAGEWEL
ncbi:hypothetical protein K490DRAFT_70009 [Saccharata proteae CBS 121410]|uniref:CREG-like beta-barrel domain-containing protein n=1 Tax=Saccharata proteae CBS 121410 TaxID=1314787 RepID=A0A9P4LSZ5_9PEZI|nr:hypothetical protein K490DRAFT_70009 [Saccharata proteae CBS 121410]